MRSARTAQERSISAPPAAAGGRKQPQAGSRQAHPRKAPTRPAQPQESRKPAPAAQEGRERGPKPRGPGLTFTSHMLSSPQMWHGSLPFGSFALSLLAAPPAPQAALAPQTILPPLLAAGDRRGCRLRVLQEPQAASDDHKSKDGAFLAAQGCCSSSKCADGRRQLGRWRCPATPPRRPRCAAAASPTDPVCRCSCCFTCRHSLISAWHPQAIAACQGCWCR